MRLRRVRSLAATLGGLVVAWQLVNAARGGFVHRFLIADLLAAAGLVSASAARDDRRAAVGMLAGFAALGGVLSAASTGALLVDGFTAGRLLATLGVVPCAVGAATLARRLTTPDTVV